MGGLEDDVPADVDQRLLLARGCSPQDEHDGLDLVADHSDHLIGEGLPALALMAGRLPGAHRQGRVEQQHALGGPVLEVAVARGLDAEVVAQLPVDVRQ
ncbi:MAG: hypothetical protein JWL72_3178 [Ilumatobacteraceae bacterium]|nr:hypothetical protein [Ilumatobacteraceae bacterium]